MNAEITKIKEISGLRGWVLYDANCPFCCRWAASLENVLTSRCFDLAPLQAPWIGECLDLRVPAIPGEMLVVTTDGNVFGGAEGVLYLARTIWWAQPLYLLGQLPVAHRWMIKLYGVIARNRLCLGNACSIPTPRS